MFWSRCAWCFAHTKVAAMNLEVSYGPNFDVQLKKSVLIIVILTVGEHDWLLVGRTWSVSSRMEVCVCFLACFLTCAAGVTSDPEEIRRGLLYPSNRTVARWQSLRSWEQKGCVWCFCQSKLWLWGGGIDRESEKTENIFRAEHRVNVDNEPPMMLCSDLTHMCCWVLGMIKLLL